MRIFQTIESSTILAIKENQTWFRNLHEPLVDLGHDVFLLPANDGRVAMMRSDSGLRGAFSEKLLDTFKREHSRKPFDLFFAYLFDGMVDPRVIDEIRDLGVPNCNFSCNNAHQFHLVRQLSPHFDYCLHAERDTNLKFESIGARPIWWPMASNPTHFKPRNVPRTIDVSFVGDNYGVRARYIASLLRSGIDAHAYGPRWLSGTRTPLRSLVKRYFFLSKSLLSMSPEKNARYSGELAEHDLRRLIWKKYPDNLHPPVSDDELIELYSSSKISLGILDVHDNHDPSLGIVRHIHLREFEAPMCGALYCTGYSDELAEMFEPDREVLMYRDAEELRDKIKYYLEHEFEAETIRTAGRRRALEDHTYQRRFTRLFEEIGLQ